MEPNYIFGLTRSLLGYDQPVRAGWVIDTGDRDYRLPMGTPCLVVKAPTEEEIDHARLVGNRYPKTVVLLPFSFCTNGAQYNNRLVLDNHHNVKTLAVKIGEETDFFDTVTELKVNRIDLGKIDRAAEYVRDVGPLTLLVNDKNEKRLFGDLVKMVGHVQKRFNYAFQGKYNHHGNRDLVVGDNCFLAITVMNLNQCIPVFDPSKADGLLLNVTTIYTEASQQKDTLCTSCEFTFCFSNHATNLTNIDGQSLGICPATPKHLESIVDSCKGYFSDVGKSLPKKEVKKTGSKKKETESEVEAALKLRKSSKGRISAGPTSNYYFSTSSTSTNTW